MAADSAHWSPSDPQKVLFPSVGGKSPLTKADVISYYRLVSERLLAMAKGRPLSLRRYPEGIVSGGFFQKRVPSWFPPWIPRVTVEKEGGTVEEVLCEDEKTLLYLAGEATIEFHTWLASQPDLRHPNRLVIDLDPSKEISLDELRKAAFDVRGVLEEDGLVPFVTTTGSRGYHVVVPLVPKADFGQVRSYARLVASRVAAMEPDARTVELSKTARGPRLFLDYLRNGYAQTSVAPYSLRGLPGAPAAVPLSWEELALGEQGVVSPQAWGASNMTIRLSEFPDPWEEMALGARICPCPT
jgi:bifunctional non-homologous end joining protein LigD